MLVGIHGAYVFQQTVVHIDLVLVVIELLLQGFQLLRSEAGNLRLFPQPVEFLVLKQALVFVALLGIVEFLQSQANR